LSRQIRSSAPDQIVRALSGDGELAVRAIVATRLVAEAAERHGTSPVASAALGRTLMGALLLAAGTKHGETTQVQVRGRGPLGSVTAIATAEGSVRGYVQNPEAGGLGHADVGVAVGRGLLSVVRHRPSWREPYSGYVPLVSGQIAEDLAHYLRESEQTRSAIALGVDVDAEGRVCAAGGYLVQALPGAAEELLDELSERIETLETPTQMLGRGLGAAEILEQVVAGEGTTGRHETPIGFVCDCSLDRVERAITLLGRAEIQELLSRGEPVVVTCHFCSERYEIPPVALEGMLARSDLSG